MPELPDITIYIDALSRRVLGRTLLRVRLNSVFVLRTVTPTLSEIEGSVVQTVQRLGKRIVLGLDNDVYLVMHLMRAGRLHWRAAGAKLGSKSTLAAFDFADGSLFFTEAGSKKRASIHVLQDAAALRAHNPGGVEPLETSLAEFSAALQRENHTLKRALTDPHIISGIGNAYSDEILHRARLSPFKQTQALSEQEWQTLYQATRTVLQEWIDRLRNETGDQFPEKVTAFREQMAVHGRYRLPCPVCGAPVQRIVYADSEANYCAHCQTGGRLLADRALSRLLHADWPKTLDALEEPSSKA